MVAILLAGPAIAFDPADTVEDDTVATKHNVYTFDEEDGRATSGIAGVLYVNKAVDIAGGAAGAAEAHAAAAGSAAISAAASADDAAGAAAAAAGAAAAAAGSAQSANDALASKEDVANKFKSTDDEERLSADNKDTLYPSVGRVQAMIGALDYATTTAVNAKVTIEQGSPNANKAVITDKDGKITTGTITKDMIGAAQVTAAKTSGVIGYIPSGSATSTTYAQIWVQ